MIKKTLLTIATTAIASLAVSAPVTIEALVVSDTDLSIETISSTPETIMEVVEPAGAKPNQNIIEAKEFIKELKEKQDNSFETISDKITAIEDLEDIDSLTTKLAADIKKDKDYLREDQIKKLNEQSKTKKEEIKKIIAEKKAEEERKAKEAEQARIAAEEEVRLQAEAQEAQRQAEIAAQEAEQARQVQQQVAQQAAPVTAPTPSYGTPGNCDSYRSLVAQYDWNVDTMMYAMYAESSCNPNAIGDDYVIAGVYAPSCGLLQVRTLAGRPSCSALQDPATNIAASYNIWLSQGYNAWTTLH